MDLVDKLKQSFNYIYADFTDNIYKHYKKQYEDYYAVKQKYEATENNFILRLGDRYQLSPQFQKWRIKYNNIYKTACDITSVSEEKYINNNLQVYEEQFDADMHIIADRIRQRNIDLNNIEFKSASADPKIFEFIITDGNKTLHGRSVKAAMNSVKLRPHLRFIIT